MRDRNDLHQARCCCCGAQQQPGPCTHDCSVFFTDRPRKEARGGNIFQGTGTECGFFRGDIFSLFVWRSGGPICCLHIHLSCRLTTHSKRGASSLGSHAIFRPATLPAIELERSMKRARRPWVAPSHAVTMAVLSVSAAAAAVAFQVSPSGQHHARRAPAVPATCRGEVSRANGWWSSASLGTAAGHGPAAGRENGNVLRRWRPSDRTKRAPALALMAPGAGVMSQEEGDRMRYLMNTAPCSFRPEITAAGERQPAKALV